MKALQTIETTKDNGKITYVKPSKIYTDPTTGESGNSKYWGEKLDISPGSFWRRVQKHGEDSPNIFAPMKWVNGKQKTCTKGTDIIWKTTVTVSKTIGEKVEDAIARKIFGYKTDLTRAAIDSFVINDSHKKLVYLAVGEGKNNKIKEGYGLVIKLNKQQSEKIDELMNSKLVWLEYCGKTRRTNISEAIEIILEQFFLEKTVETEVSPVDKRKRTASGVVAKLKLKQLRNLN